MGSWWKRRARRDQQCRAPAREAADASRGQPLRRAKSPHGADADAPYRDGGATDLLIEHRNRLEERLHELERLTDEKEAVAEMLEGAEAHLLDKHLRLFDKVEPIRRCPDAARRLASKPIAVLPEQCHRCGKSLVQLPSMSSREVKALASSVSTLYKRPDGAVMLEPCLPSRRISGPMVALSLVVTLLAVPVLVAPVLVFLTTASVKETISQFPPVPEVLDDPPMTDAMELAFPAAATTVVASERAWSACQDRLSKLCEPVELPDGAGLQRYASELLKAGELETAYCAYAVLDARTYRESCSVPSSFPDSPYLAVMHTLEGHLCESTGGRLVRDSIVGFSFRQRLIEARCASPPVIDTALRPVQGRLVNLP